MTSRKVLCLLVLILIASASLCLVPFGHGPSSAVYGPNTAFRTYRASLQLRSAMATTVVIIFLMASVFVFSRPTYSVFDPDSRLAKASPTSMIVTLRC